MDRAILSIILLALLFGCTQPEATPSDGQAGGAGGAAQVGSNGAAETATVHIRGFAFEPQEITVRQGQTLRWVNDDSASHTVKSEGVFESPVIQKDGTFEHTFGEAPGEYAYSCGIHPSMHGTVIVTG